MYKNNRDKCLPRVESGSDDLDNLGQLGHFYVESSGSHPKLNYLDVTRISYAFRITVLVSE